MRSIVNWKNERRTLERIRRWVVAVLPLRAVSSGRVWVRRFVSSRQVASCLAVLFCVPSSILLRWVPAFSPRRKRL
jgi:hypothetical protein